MRCQQRNEGLKEPSYVIHFHCYPNRADSGARWENLDHPQVLKGVGEVGDEISTDRAVIQLPGTKIPQVVLGLIEAQSGPDIWEIEDWIEDVSRPLQRPPHVKRRLSSPISGNWACATVVD